MLAFGVGNSMAVDTYTIPHTPSGPCLTVEKHRHKLTSRVFGISAIRDRVRGVQYSEGQGASRCGRAREHRGLDSVRHG